MDIQAVRLKLAEAVEAAATSDIPLTVYAYVPDDGPTPFAYIQAESLTYDRAFAGGSVEAYFTVMVMVSRADDVTSQRQVDNLMSDSHASSIYAAIQAANGAPGQEALDGEADFVHCIGTEGPPRWYDWREGVKYHGVGFRVRVLGTQG